MKIFFVKVTQWWTVLIPSLICLILVVVAIFFISAHFREDYIVSASGRHTLSFNVFYFEDTIFGESPNPISRDQGFLMSYTNYIEIDNSFLIELSRRANVDFRYHAEARLVIRHMGTADANLNRIVFQETFPLVEEMQGRIYAYQFNSRGGSENGASTVYWYNFRVQNENNTPDGRFRIYPIEYIRKYLDFIYDQMRQLEHQGNMLGGDTVLVQGLRGFSAELFIDFTFNIYDTDILESTDIIDTSINQQSATHGFRLSLTTEVYSLIISGIPHFEWQTNLITQRVEITLIRAILFIVAFLLFLFVALFSSKKLCANPNEKRQEVIDILRKYHQEIVVYDQPAETSRYYLRKVEKFKELLKLSVNLNKHIMCYKDESHAQFVTFVGEYACVHEVHYDDNFENNDNAEDVIKSDVEADVATEEEVVELTTLP